MLVRKQAPNNHLYISIQPDKISFCCLTKTRYCITHKKSVPFHCTIKNIFNSKWTLFLFILYELTIFFVNQKRAAYVRMAIGLRGLERKCHLVCLWARLLDSLIVISASTLPTCALSAAYKNTLHSQKWSKTFSMHSIWNCLKLSKIKENFWFFLVIFDSSIYTLHSRFWKRSALL